MFFVWLFSFERGSQLSKIMKALISQRKRIIKYGMEGKYRFLKQKFAQKLLKFFFKSDVTFKNCSFSWILELIVRFGVEKVSVKYYYYSVPLKTKSNNISIIPGFGSRSCSQQVQWGPFYKVFSKKGLKNSFVEMCQ